MNLRMRFGWMLVVGSALGCGRQQPPPLKSDKGPANPPLKQAAEEPEATLPELVEKGPAADPLEPGPPAELLVRQADGSEPVSQTQEVAAGLWRAFVRGVGKGLQQEPPESDPAGAAPDLQDLDEPSPEDGPATDSGVIPPREPESSAVGDPVPPTTPAGEGTDGGG